MKAQPIRYEKNEHGIGGSREIICEPKDATHVKIRIPSLRNEYRVLPVQIGGTRRDTGNWSWNGDIDKPTLKPSILTQSGYFDGERTIPFRCHTFVNDGMVQFLSDCSHDNKNKTLELLDIK